MRLKQKKSKKILFIVIPLGIIVLALLVYVFLFNGSLFGWQFRQESPSNINLSPPTEEETNTGKEIKEESIEQGQGKPTTGGDASPNKTETISVGFSAINQNEGTLQIRLMIQEVLSEGTCTLTLSQNGRSVTKTADVYPTASISTCRGFDIATSELDKGTWDITVEVISGERKGHVTTNTQIN